MVVKVTGNQVNLDAPPPSSSATPSLSGNNKSEKTRETNTSLTSPSSSNVGHGIPHKFAYDFSYWSHDRKDAHFAGQDQVFKDLGLDVVENAFNGYNVCVFAYGQTGSGKTYTMGTGFEMGCAGETLGIIPRAVRQLFLGIKERQDESKEKGVAAPEFKVSAQFMELYNEEILDSKIFPTIYEFL